MRRLLIKELKSAWWIIGLAYAMVAFVVLMGDPLGFRGYGDGELFVCLMLPFLALGLRAYSLELSSGTVDFLYSHPIKWWQIFLAKLIVGLLAVVSTVLLGLLMYVLSAPHYYMPFLHEQVLAGLGEIMLVLGVSFAAGFAASALMPGIAMSFASLVGIVMVMAIVDSGLWQLGRLLDVRWLRQSAENIPYCGMLIALAVIPIARALPKYGTQQRLRIVSYFLAASVIIAMVLAAFGIPGKTASKPSTESLSPNGQWALYGKDQYTPNSRYGLANMRTGRVCLVIPTTENTSVIWSPDSSKVAVITGKALFIARTGKNPDLWKPSLSERRYGQWSPDSRLLFVPRKKGYFMLDIDHRTISGITPKEFARYEDVVPQPGGDPVYVKGHGLFWPPVIQ